MEDVRLCRRATAPAGAAGEAGERGMTETQTLLGKIAALRQRLEQAQGLAGEAGSAAAALAGGDGGRLEVLHRQAAAGAEHDALVDVALRQFGDPDGGPTNVFPRQLTARA